MSRAKSDWELNATALSRLMARLSSDPDVAGEKYEQLRRTLIRFFGWRGVSDSEECTDIAIDRLARRLDEGHEVENIQAFAYGVARLVMLEQTRKRDARHVPLDETVSTPPANAEPEDPLRECFDACLQEVPQEGRTLLLRYYTGDKRAKIDARIALARELTLSQNALRSRAQRLRERIERCTVGCASAHGIVIGQGDRGTA